MKRAAEFLLGGALVYVAMAANAAGCSSSPGADDGPLGAGGQGGAPAAQAGASGRGQGAAGQGQGAGGEGVAGMAGGSGAAGAVAQAGASGSSGSPGAGGAGGIFNPVPDADAATPGTRLKPKVFVGTDGSKQPTQLWSDTQRGGEECSFRLAADGAYRCLPTSVGATFGFFQDASCTTPAFAVQASCGASSAPAYVTVVPGCGANASVYQRGSTLSSAYVGQPGACSPYTASFYAFYALAGEVPPSAFVAAELRAE